MAEVLERKAKKTATTEAHTHLQTKHTMQDIYMHTPTHPPTHTHTHTPTKKTSCYT
jgi:hypothetical protein